MRYFAPHFFGANVVFGKSTNNVWNWYNDPWLILNPSKKVCCYHRNWVVGLHFEVSPLLDIWKLNTGRWGDLRTASTEEEAKSTWGRGHPEARANTRGILSLYWRLHVCCLIMIYTRACAVVIPPDLWPLPSLCNACQDRDGSNASFQGKNEYSSMPSISCNTTQTSSCDTTARWSPYPTLGLPSLPLLKAVSKSGKLGRKSDSLVPGTTFQSSAILGCVQITNILARVTGDLTESNLLDFMNYNSTSWTPLITWLCVFCFGINLYRLIELLPAKQNQWREAWKVYNDSLLLYACVNGNVETVKAIMQLGSPAQICRYIYMHA